MHFSCSRFSRSHEVEKIELLKKYFYQQVGPLKVKDLQATLLGVVSGANSQLGNLLKNGKVEKVAQMSYAALSVVEEGVILPEQRKVVTIELDSILFSCFDKNKSSGSFDKAQGYKKL